MARWRHAHASVGKLAPFGRALKTAVASAGRLKSPLTKEGIG